MKLDIKKLNDPVLRQPTEKVDSFDMELQSLIDNMIETMRSENGVGLAAPQIGVSKKIIVLEFSGDKESDMPGFPLTVLCNPKITEASEEQKNIVEGCLSFPGMEILVKRPKKVTVTGEDRYGNRVEIQADGLYARVLQHEVDHLNCTLLIDHIQETDIIFIGTGSLGVPALKLLAQDPQYRIKLVITAKSASTSRKYKEKINPILQTAKQLKLPVLETTNINDDSVVEKIRDTKVGLGIMADFGQIIKKNVLDSFKLGIINIHPSLLPRYRGPSPVQQTILNGDKVAGVSLILTGEKMDAGGIISQGKVKLLGSETSFILKDYLAEFGASLLLNSIPYYLAQDLKPIPQNEEKSTYTRLFKKEDGFVDENTPATVVERKIRAFEQWPKVYAIVKNKRVQLLASHFGKEGTFIVDRVKPEGKNEMSYEDFVRGYHTTLTFRS